MNKICKEYMGEIKTLFPIIKKPEKAYINKLASDVEDHCEETGVTSKQELYDNYGMPYEVVSNYLSTVSNDHLMKLLKASKYIRKAVVYLLILATIATTMFVTYMFHRHDVIEQNRIVLQEVTISNGEVEEDTYNKGFFAEEFYPDKAVQETTE